MQCMLATGISGYLPSGIFRMKAVRALVAFPIMLRGFAEVVYACKNIQTGSNLQPQMRYTYNAMWSRQVAYPSHPISTAIEISH